jgi:methionyl-tRNA formyltransferase
VVTAPDKPSGRGLKPSPSPVKEAALRHHIPVLQPEKLKAPEFLDELRSYQANLQIVVAFRMLPEVVWRMPEYGTFNLHASLLPQYRGAAPINWAIINGEKESGITTFFLQHEIDTGDLIKQIRIPIEDNDNAGSLYEKMMLQGAELVLESVRLIAADAVIPQPQQYSGELKNAPKIFRETCEINFGQSAEAVRNFVRGLTPFPGAWTRYQDKIYKISSLSASSDEKKYEPGQWYTDGKSFIHIGTSDGYVTVNEIQAEGKRKMQVDEFLRGNKIS